MNTDLIEDPYFEEQETDNWVESSGKWLHDSGVWHAIVGLGILAAIGSLFVWLLD